ncbi:hypothetical protein MLD38_033530 [Melastoma candidum]|uniref:Uncharacterized protein n=1 Tax=Melastoma candidum TaxID=119954 RepID=A0ACB9M717_9MYRT|nr:hypothetical protein MLD38_033530 [Melastoma candidum]
MGSVELTVTSAKDLKNVNWRNGSLSPYVVVWVDPNNKCSTRVDDEGDSFPVWDQTLSIPLPPHSTDDDTILYLDVVHAGSEPGTKPLIGSAKLTVRDVIDDVGYGERTKRSLQLKRPSGRPHGKIDVKISVREPSRYRMADPYSAPPHAYGVQTRDVSPQQYGYQYSKPQDSYYSNAPPPTAGYPSSYGSVAAAPVPAYGQQGYGSVQDSYGQPSYGGAQGSYGQPMADQQKSRFGVGTGLAVGAVAGVLGTLALQEGVDHVEDEIAERAAEKLEEDYYNSVDDY